MKISVRDFKGISLLENFDIRKINILTGVNSGGKSSLIQLLLLIKQSLEARSSESPLKLNRPYVSLGRFESLVRKGKGINSFSVEMRLKEDELSPRLLRMLSKGLSRGKEKSKTVTGLRDVSLFLSFKKASEKIVVDDFKIDIFSDENLFIRVKRNSHGKSHQVETNAPDLLLGYDEESTFHEGIESFSGHVGFYSFFPEYYEKNGGFSGFSPVIDLLRLCLQKIYAGISYVGPLREEPKEFYFQDDDFINHIGNKGENSAYLLAKHARHLGEYWKLKIRPDTGEASYDKEFVTLENAVNFWMCDVFRLAVKISVSRAKTNRNIYEIYLTNSDGTQIPITHVGFGISQIFPILVEVLRPAEGKRLIILEQPEIHLHPRVQALLFDFINSSSQDISFLVETHSDHFINRLRRRIAEEEGNEIIFRTNMTFVNYEGSQVVYRTLGISEIGSIDYWPEGFFDQYEQDVRALVKAQARKRVRSK